MQPRALSIQFKIPDISVGTSNGTDHFGLVPPEFSGPALKVVHFDRSVGPNCPFPFDKTVVPSIALLYPAFKINNQTRGGLGRICEISEISNRNFYWIERAHSLVAVRNTNSSHADIHVEIGYFFEAIDMKVIYYSLPNRAHFHKKALHLASSSK